MKVLFKVKCSLWGGWDTSQVCDLRTDSVVVEYGVEGNGWSCQWSATDSNQVSFERALFRLVGLVFVI